MEQFIPKVSENDAKRILKREFPVELHDEINKLIAKVTVREKLRVVVACIKNANRNYSKLLNALENADGYWREEISEAEYPKIKKARNLTNDEISEKRKNQYLLWFNKIQ